MKNSAEVIHYGSITPLLLLEHRGFSKISNMTSLSVHACTHLCPRITHIYFMKFIKATVSENVLRKLIGVFQLEVSVKSLSTVL